MRINVYAEELTDDAVLVSKVVSEGPQAGMVFYGVRFYLQSPPALHDDAEDDDRSAITIWVPWTKRDAHQPVVVGSLLYALIDALGDFEDPKWAVRSVEGDISSDAESLGDF